MDQKIVDRPEREIERAIARVRVVESSRRSSRITFKCPTPAR